MDGVRKVPPVYEVVTNGVPPVNPGELRGISLVEEVPAALPEAQPVGIVQVALGAHEVVEGTMGI